MSSYASTLASKPQFWSTPIRYLRWSAHERPSYFWSCVLTAIGPLMVLVVPPIRHRLGDGPRPLVPMTYPIPNGPRKQLTGYDDPE